jgi:hypothetical protein
MPLARAAGNSEAWSELGDYPCLATTGVREAGERKE